MTTKLAAQVRGRCRASPRTTDRPRAWTALSMGTPMFQVLYRSSICLAALAASSTAFAEDATAHEVAADADRITVTATHAQLVHDQIHPSVPLLDKEPIAHAHDTALPQLLIRTTGTTLPTHAASHTH